MNTELTFINRSADGQNSEIVLFQKNIATDMQELAVAWKVIRYCGLDCYHPISYPLNFEVSISDEWGNHSPRVTAVNGQMLTVMPTVSGRQLKVSGPATSSLEIQVVNGLSRGAFNVNLFKAGQLLACKTTVAPQQKAVFEYKPTLWIGVASQIVQGQPLNSAIISNINTEFSLMGVASANIVMRGGGGGPDSVPYTFTLENVVAI